MTAKPNHSPSNGARGSHEPRAIGQVLERWLREVKPTPYRFGFGAPDRELRGEAPAAAIRALAKWRDELLSEDADPAEVAEQGELRDGLEELTREIGDLISGAQEWAQEASF